MAKGKHNFGSKEFKNYLKMSGTRDRLSKGDTVIDPFNDTLNSITQHKCSICNAYFERSFLESMSYVANPNVKYSQLPSQAFTYLHKYHFCERCSDIVRSTPQRAVSFILIKEMEAKGAPVFDIFCSPEQLDIFISQGNKEIDKVRMMWSL